MPRTRAVVAAAAASVLAALCPPGAAAQEPPAPLVARANVTVDNSSPVPQFVAGTNAPPFELPPYRQAVLAMTAAVPPAATGTGTPVRFFYSVGEAPGPQCRGTIDMSIVYRGTPASVGWETNCVAHALGIGGARCTIAVSVRHSACEGGLAFIAP